MGMFLRRYIPGRCVDILGLWFSSLLSSTLSLFILDVRVFVHLSIHYLKLILCGSGEAGANPSSHWVRDGVNSVGRQFITETHGDKPSFILTFTLMVVLESPIDLFPNLYLLGLWEEAWRNLPRERTQQNWDSNREPPCCEAFCMFVYFPKIFYNAALI